MTIIANTIIYIDQPSSLIYHYYIIMSRGSLQVYISWRALIQVTFQLNHIINDKTCISSYFPVFQVLITTIQGQLNQQIQRNLLWQSRVRTISTSNIDSHFTQVNHIINTETVACIINTFYETVTVRIASCSMYFTTNTIKTSRTPYSWLNQLHAKDY